VSLSELGDLLKSRRQPRQFTTPTQSLDGLQLVVRSSARPNEVRVVGIRQAIGARASRRHDRALFEQQHGPARAGKGECVSDRFDSLCVRDGVPPPVEDSEMHTFFVCDAGEKVGALGSCAADLEVRGTRPTERPATEQRSAHVRRPAARAYDDPPRWTLERREAGGEHSGFVEHLQRAFVPGDVELVPRAAVEGSPRVRPDLGRDSERAQQAEGSAGHRGVCDVEMHGKLAATLQVHAPRRMKEP
jgi:hypothetical protein